MDIEKKERLERMLEKAVQPLLAKITEMEKEIQTLQAGQEELKKLLKQ